MGTAARPSAGRVALAEDEPTVDAIVYIVIGDLATGAPLLFRFGSAE